MHITDKGMLYDIDGVQMAVDVFNTFVLDQVIEAFYIPIYYIIPYFDGAKLNVFVLYIKHSLWWIRTYVFDNCFMQTFRFR